MPVSFQHELLIQARVGLGLTQEEAARAVGVDVRTYRRYESGEVNEGGGFALQRASRRRIVERLCRELGLDEGELLLSVEATPLVVARLPRARHFVGREAQLARLRAWLTDAASAARVLAIVAIGGAGKTSLLERALSAPGCDPFVHSFYEEPSVDVCLGAAARYLGQTGEEPLEAVLQGLKRRPSAVLVLDGLELVQADGEGERARGELQDRRLVRLLRAVARARGFGRVLVTTRFPLVDLAAHEGTELETLALPPLDAAETRSLLELWGARSGGVSVLDAHQRTGGHALSLAVLGSYASELLRGDLSAATELHLSDAARDLPLARKLQGMLTRYASELSPLERRLLVLVCIFPRGVAQSALTRLPELAVAPELELRAALGRLCQRGLVVLSSERYSAHPFVRAHFAAQAPDATAIHEQERARLSVELEGQPQHRPQDAALLDAYEQLFEHTLAAGDVAGAARVAERTLGGFANLGLRLGEFERGLRLVRALERTTAALPADVRWRITYDRGLYSAALGDLDEAVRAYRALLQQSDEDATTHRTLAYTLRLRGDLEEASRHVERSIELGRAERALGTVSRGLALRGAIRTSAGSLAEAAAAFDEARALGDSPTARRSIWEAELWLARGETERALSATAENLAACRQRGWAGHVAHCHVLLGRGALIQGDLPAAEESLDAALDWCARSREVELTLEARLLELGIARACGDEPRATEVRGHALDAAIAGGFGTVRAALER